MSLASLTEQKPVPTETDALRAPVQRLTAALLDLLRSLDSLTIADAETLMLVAGAVAGRCAIAMVWPSCTETPPREAGLAKLGTASGRTLYFGDALDRSIVPRGERSGSTLWETVSRAALAEGARAQDLPGVAEMFQHVTATIGTRRFGVARTCGRHRPAVSTNDALAIAWPRVLQVFEVERSGEVPPGGLPPSQWPLVANRAAGEALAIVAPLLDPGVAVRIVMEAAIAGAKIDPHAVPSPQPLRRWRLTALISRLATPVTGVRLGEAARSMSPIPFGRR